MSPTENELRAALRHGEGDGPDPFVVAAAGRRARARRRSRMVNTAAAVILIGGLGTVGTVVLQNAGTDEHAGGSMDMGAAAKAPHALSQQNAAGGASGHGSAQTRSAPAGGAPVLPPGAAKPAPNSCPATAPAVPTPGTPGTAGPLFPQAPTDLVVCTYTSVAGSAGPGALVLTGTDARAVLASLDAASTTRPSGMCPNYRLAGERTVEIIGRSASGAPVGAVRTTLDRPACATVVTNGTAVRYGWRPPQELVRKVGPLGGRSHGPVAQATSPSR